LARTLARRANKIRQRIRETKVVDRILHNLSLLFERTFNSVQDLNRYRKEDCGAAARGAIPDRRRRPPERFAAAAPFAAPGHR